MRTYKENIIELADGETVVIRAERGSHQKLVQIEVDCTGWYDYEGQPNGFEIKTINDLRQNGEPLGGTIEVIPPDLKLDRIELQDADGGQIVSQWTRNDGELVSVVLGAGRHIEARVNGKVVKTDKLRPSSNIFKVAEEWAEDMLQTEHNIKPNQQ